MTKYIEIDGIGEVVPRSEYDALAAQLAALRNVKRYSMTTEYNRFACEDQVVVSEFADGDYVKYSDIEKHIAATPQQHLAEIRAECVERALKTISHRWKPDTYGDAAFMRVSELKEYADKIRQGGAE